MHDRAGNLVQTLEPTTRRGVNRREADPYRLRRIGVGNYGESLFDVKLAVGL